MNKEELSIQFKKLYKKYDIDDTELNQMSSEQISKSVKGLLANLDGQIKGNYRKEDLDTIKDIYYFYG